jgi:hypothetical protein
MRIYYFYIILLLSFNTEFYAQRLETKNVLKIGDSILKASTNLNIYKYFTGYEGSYQKFKKGKYYSHSGFTNRKILNAKAEEIWILYHFNYPDVENMSNGVWIKLNKNLQLIEKLNLDFIPEFLWYGKESNFISKQKALKIGIQNFKEMGLRINEPYLIFNKTSKSYNYRVENVLTKTKNIMGKDSGEMEVLEIDAISGEINSSQKGIYGVIIR